MVDTYGNHPDRFRRLVGGIAKTDSALVERLLDRFRDTPVTQETAEMVIQAAWDEQARKGGNAT